MPASTRIRRAVLVWPLLFAFLTALLALGASHSHGHPPYLLRSLIIAAVGATFSLGLWWLIRCSCNRGNFGRLLIGMAISATVLAVFYLEEDWRGERAWEQCKAELEAGGLVMDWDKYIPPPVPDDQNFYMASTNILTRFKKAQSDAEIAMATNNTWLRIFYNSFPELIATRTNPLVIASILISSPTAVGLIRGTNDLVINQRERGAQERIQGAIRNSVGRSVKGAQGFTLLERSLSQLPAHVRLGAETPVARSDIETLVPKDLVTNLGQLQIAATGDNRTFNVLLTGKQVIFAADYLKWSDQYVPALDEVREALKRPYAVLPGDYRPYWIPIANFVAIRAVAQTLAQRAQCDFLLGRPDEALHETTLIHDLCRILERPPTGRPITLVEAMIDVAIHGLYVSTIADGFRLQTWQEPQLIALQKQLQTIHLPSQVMNAFEFEIVSSSYDLQTATSAELRRIFTYQRGNWLWYGLWYAPRGWLYQNTVVAAKLQQKPLAAFDLPNDLIHPEPAERQTKEVEMALDHFSLWNWWASITVPSTAKAMRTTAYNQTMVNEAQIVCALQRHQLAHGEYPAALESLVPQFIEQLPHDIIGGQPLHYRRTEDGKFLLYSIGWNETDDGGVPGTLADVKNDDWVWQ
jgi:hypothetical protein